MSQKLISKLILKAMKLLRQKKKLHLSMNKFEVRSRYLTETSMLLLEPGLAIKIMLSKNAIPLSTLTSLIPLIVFYSAL